MAAAQFTDGHTMALEMRLRCHPDATPKDMNNRDTKFKPRMWNLKTCLNILNNTLFLLAVLNSNLYQICDAFVSPTSQNGIRQQHHKINQVTVFSPQTIKRTTHHANSIALRLFDTNLDEIAMSLQSSASSLAQMSLSSGTLPSPTALLALYAAGLLTSFSPCTFGMLPLTLSYISTAAGERSDKTAFIPTLAFAAGLASVFCGLGLSVAFLGGVFGGGTGNDNLAGGLILALASSGVSVAMGLQLLNLIKLPLPSFELGPPPPATMSSADESSTVNASQNDASVLLRTFLLGGSSALAASPCSTPVLTSILATVAASRDVTTGVTLLGIYTMGYATPLLAVSAAGGQVLARARAAAFSDGTGGMSFMGRVGSVVQPLSAGVLIWFGTDGLLNALFGDPSLAGLPIVQ